ncbi:MAG: hypothetical protein E7413_01880 [Ruminococcaceae bacterium]|nr:hypothetical protein [Oscillospiraceae bacterium]
MKKEFMKTVVLTCLVISSLVLSAHIWHEKELWSLDYNSFVHSLQNFFTKDTPQEPSEDYDVKYWSQVTPEFISFTYGSQRMISYPASPQFPQNYQIASDILLSLEKNGNLATITEEEYLNAYKTNSMMLKYSNRVNLQELLGKDDTFFDDVPNPISSTFVIGIDVAQATYLTFMDDSSGHAYQLPVKFSANTKKVEDQISVTGQNASYAYELNFDTDTDNSGRILFERFVPILLEATQVQKLEVEPVMYSSSYDSVFKSFHIVKNSARSYRDKDGAIHFIENRSTLKIREDGAFRFETGDIEAGIQVSASMQQEALTEFVNVLYRNIVPESDGYLAVFSHSEQGNRHTYEFMYHTPNGFLYQKDQPAVRVVCEDGVIVEYEQIVLNVKLSDQILATTGVIEAYDFLYNQPDIAGKTNQRIQSMFPCNMMENGQISVGWFCQFSDGTVSCFAL